MHSPSAAIRFELHFGIEETRGERIDSTGPYPAGSRGLATTSSASPASAFNRSTKLFLKPET